jgi:hypothetical protein
MHADPKSGRTRSAAVMAAHANAARALANEFALELVVPSLRAHGIRPIVIKGFVTARLLGRSLFEHRSDDVDLLVAPDDLDAAADVLTELGFRHKYAGARRSETGHALAHVRGGAVPLAIDLHHSLMLATDPARTFEVLSRNTEQMTIGRVTVEVPDAAGSALIIALHAAHHGNEFTKPRADLRRALAVVPDDVWLETGRRATEMAVGWGLMTGLRTVPEGDRVARILDLRANAPIEIRVRADGASAGGEKLARLLQARHLAEVVVAVRDALLPSRALVVSTHPELANSRLQLAGFYLRRLSRGPRAVRQLIRVAGEQAGDGGP